MAHSDTATFLSPAEIKQLTGWCVKRKQITHLKEQNIPFWVNGAGWPVVARSAIETPAAKQTHARKAWQPALNA